MNEWKNGLTLVCILIRIKWTTSPATRRALLRQAQDLT